MEMTKAMAEFDYYKNTFQHAELTRPPDGVLESSIRKVTR
jgi:hypothetical protein